jgi:hypothetical protein
MPTIEASSSWARRTLAVGAVLVIPALVLGMVAADAPLIRSQELPWMPSDSSLRLLAYAHTSGMDEPDRIVVRSPAEWAAVWRQWETRQGVKTDPPTVDFETEMVFVAALGTRSYSGDVIVIDSLTETTDELVVHVRTRGPRGCIVGHLVSQPTVAVAAPARPKPVRFVDRVQRSDCD